MKRSEKRTLNQNIDCVRRVLLNIKEHEKHNDPKRLTSIYLRYALDEFAKMNLYTSLSAQKSMNQDVIKEHVIPHKVIMNMLTNLENPNHKAIYNIVSKYFIICRITKDEDERLRIAKLVSSMPDDWTIETGSVFARYEKVGIEVIKI